VGVAGSPVTGRRRGGVLNVTAAAWTAGFLRWRSGGSGNKKRTQNVNEYMLVIALCLVTSVAVTLEVVSKAYGTNYGLIAQFILLADDRQFWHAMSQLKPCAMGQQ